MAVVVRTEKLSVRSREARDELASILDFIRPNDTLMVVKLDRLGRSTRDVLNLVHELVPLHSDYDSLSEGSG
jgi:DNA invertase Pin-like site-specific DNA recombinase